MSVNFKKCVTFIYHKLFVLGEKIISFSRWQRNNETAGWKQCKQATNFTTCADTPTVLITRCYVLSTAQIAGTCGTQDRNRVYK